MTTSMSFVPEDAYPLLITPEGHFEVTLPKLLGSCAVA